MQLLHWNLQWGTSLRSTATCTLKRPPEGRTIDLSICYRYVFIRITSSSESKQRAIFSHYYVQFIQKTALSIWEAKNSTSRQIHHSCPNPRMNTTPFPLIPSTVCMLNYFTGKINILLLILIVICCFYHFFFYQHLIVTCTTVLEIFMKLSKDWGYTMNK